MQGQVQKYDVLRGFGFILVGLRERIFFHVNNWNSDAKPEAGMLVEFETAPSKKNGMPDQAVNVRPKAGA